MRTRSRPNVAWSAPLALGLVAANLALAPPTHAYEDSLSLGAGVGYAYATAPGRSHHGAAFNLESSIGVTPVWSLRGLLGFNVHPAQPRLSRLTLGAEALYLVDVLEVVPYVGGGIDGLASFAGGTSTLAFGAHPVFGVDWLASRSLVLGVCARPIFVLSEFETQPVYLTVSLTASWLMEL